MVARNIDKSELFISGIPKTCAIPLLVPVLHQYIYCKNSQILRNSLKFTFLTISGCK